MGRLASYGLSPRYLTKGPLLADKSTAANLKGESVIIQDVRNDNRIQYPAQAEEEGIASMVSIPIVVSEDVLGAVRLYHQEIWEVSEQDLDSLKLLAVFIGLAMIHVSLWGAITHQELAEHWITPLKNGGVRLVVHTFYMMRAAYNQQRREFSKAIEDWSKAIELRRDNSEARRQRGDLYRRLANPDMAIADYPRGVPPK